MANHDVMYDILFGHKPNTSNPVEFKVFNRVSDDLNDSMESHSFAFIRQVANASERSGVGEYKQYVFSVINGNRDAWPVMPKDLSVALLIGKWVMGQSGTLPNYKDGFRVPPEQMTNDVNRSILNVAKWCANEMRRDIIVDYIKILKSHAKAYAKANNAVITTMLLVDFKTDFEATLSSKPMAIRNGMSMNRLVNFMAV